MTVWTAEDRSLAVPPGHTVSTAWIPIDSARLGNRARIAVGDIDIAYRKLLCLGSSAAWPCIVGEWMADLSGDAGSRGRFTILDGRHEYIASLMLGRTHILVAWLERPAMPVNDNEEDTTRRSA